MFSVNRLRSLIAQGRVVLGGREMSTGPCCLYVVWPGRRTEPCNTPLGSHESHYGRHLFVYSYAPGKGITWHHVGAVCPRCAVEIRARWQDHPPTPDVYAWARGWSHKQLHDALLRLRRQMHEPFNTEVNQ